MKPQEIVEAVAELFEKPYEASEFPFDFLRAFGNNETAIKKLRMGDVKPSDVPHGVVRSGQIHLATCEPGGVERTLAALRSSPRNGPSKVKFILATDGEWLEAENLRTGDGVATAYAEFDEQLSFILALGGFSSAREVKEQELDVKAARKLNKLVLELLKTDRAWGEDAMRTELNHFLARLVFCLFAERTDIFPGKGLFTRTVGDMAKGEPADANGVIETLFRAMNVDRPFRKAQGIPDWTTDFPYVNGDLFAGSTATPKFSRSALNYLRMAGGLDWGAINPDIFGSMIQRVADKGERGSLGMHYTSVPNIRKVLDPLFLDDLRLHLERAGDNGRALLNLRKRMARIRVFDPACGSGNFLVIAYKEMREIEAAIDLRRGETGRKSGLPLSNFRGIEIDGFACEIARLALIIAQFQADVRHRGPLEAKADFLPLAGGNWITHGNALRLDWTAVFNPESEAAPKVASDLFEDPLRQQTIDFENEGGETYLCGNPPYAGYNRQSESQKSDIASVFSSMTKNFGNLDYVSSWFGKAAMFNQVCGSRAAFVATNSICQGSHVPILWPLMYGLGQEICFARTSFKWSNLAQHNAGITVIVVGIQNESKGLKQLYQEARDSIVTERTASVIGPYLVPESTTIVTSETKPLANIPNMTLGNHPYYASDLILSRTDKSALVESFPEAKALLRPYYGSSEVIGGVCRVCLWIEDHKREVAMNIPDVRRRIESVKAIRELKLSDATAQKLVKSPHRFRDSVLATKSLIVVPQVSSERREYLPVGLLGADAVISFQAYGLLDAELWSLSLIASRLHWVWIGTVCRRMRTDFSYSNTLGWNTFPVPLLTTENREELTRRAEDILLARERYFPATIAELYDPERMPADLRAAHEANDDTLERIYVGRRFRNDTERLEHLFERYTAMVAKGEREKGRGKARVPRVQG